MTLSEKQMEEILGQDIQISEVVNERICDTYKMLNTANKGQNKHGRRHRHSYIAAAAVICCLVVPTAVYAAANSDFFDGMFGNTTKKSTPAVTKEVDNQKGGTTSVTIPSHEYVSVDPEEAERLIGDGAMSEPVEKQLGEHTLRVENLVYDKNSAFMYFTLEREGGVTMLVGGDEYNESKGAYFADDELYLFNVETTEGTPYADYIYIDTEKSTADKFYCYSYMVSFDTLKEGEYPALNIVKYPCKRADLTEEDEIEVETVRLTEEEPIPVQKVDMGEDGYIEYSPVSLAIELNKGLGLSEEAAADLYSIKHLEIKYKDGTSYVIYDMENNIDNSSYSCGVDGVDKLTYNRLVDTDEMKEIIVNDVAFPVE